MSAINPKPLVTLILPIRNEGSYIRRALDAVRCQDYPAVRMEVLVVDGMSTDGTRLAVANFQHEHGAHFARFALLDNPSRIVPCAMNIAMPQSRGEIIIRVDGHCKIAPDYVRQCVMTLKRTQADNVGGKMNAIGSNPFGKAIALATSTPFGVGGARFHYSDQEEWVDTVYMGAWPRSVFEKIGLFDEELVRDQDDEFNYRLREQGGCILLSPTIRSEYSVRSALRALWLQYYQYGYWKVRVLQKHPLQMRPRQFAPPLFVAALLIAILLAFFYPLGRVIFACLVGSYLLTNLFASMITAGKRGWQGFPLLPLVYIILHLSYGLGFLVGLVRFAGRWRDKRGKVPEWPRIEDS